MSADDDGMVNLLLCSPTCIECSEGFLEIGACSVRCFGLCGCRWGCAFLVQNSVFTHCLGLICGLNVQILILGCLPRRISDVRSGFQSWTLDVLFWRFKVMFFLVGNPQFPSTTYVFSMVFRLTK